jgi:hypothetical protein
MEYENETMYRVKVQAQIENSNGEKEIVTKVYLENTETQIQPEEKAVNDFCNRVFPYWR